VAERSYIIECEDVPLDEVRRMCCGPRMDPELYRALTEKIASLDNTVPACRSRRVHDRPPRSIVCSEALQSLAFQ
jgi:hypothetical protein